MRGNAAREAADEVEADARDAAWRAAWAEEWPTALADAEAWSVAENAWQAEATAVVWPAERAEAVTERQLALVIAAIEEEEEEESA